MGVAVLSGLVVAEPVAARPAPDSAPARMSAAPGASGIETLDVTIPASLQAQGLALPSKLVKPTGSGKHPAILLLHGSGGLLKDGSGNGACSNKMESQYAEWSSRLAGLGYVVLAPSSYSPRGVCDTHGKLPKHFDDKAEQILSRIYDTDAASRYLCALPEVDCKRMGVMGFSQGGTQTLLALHWQIDRTISEFRKSNGGSVDIKLPDMKPGRPKFKMGVAYYPGCGFEGIMSKGKSTEDKYFPENPLTILHGSKDSLLKYCTGIRKDQSREVAKARGIADNYSITVYSGAGHSFDQKSGSARDAALKVTLSKFSQL
ncbi:MAG: dienelactone hydrolase [Acidimicrobiales bacterium]|nr:dienelactone hydrolase [Acidimicrobiales bacterium]